MPWQGVWHAEIDMGLELPVAPVGPAIIVIGLTAPMRGIVDDKASGRFLDRAKIRVLGGMGGWEKNVLAFHYKNPIGILSNVVLAQTAAEVGEQCVQVVPKLLGTDYARLAGPASRVLAGLDWYVNELGITIVGPRIPFPAPDLEILEWDPREQRAEIASETLVTPGMIITSPLRGLTAAIVRDVEHTFDANGGRATAWCSSVTGSASGRITSVLGSLVRELAGVQNLKSRRYIVVGQTPPPDGKYLLQPVEFLGEAPPIIAAEYWPGMSGLSAKPVPGTEVAVVFLEGDNSRPVVAHWDSQAPPLELGLDAVLIRAGGLAAINPVAQLPPGAALWFAQVASALNGLAPGSVSAPPPLPSTVLLTR